MIKDLLKFINGDIYSSNKTNQTLYLSNGHSYNSRLFHQCLGILRIFLNKNINDNEEIQELNRIILEKQNTLRRKIAELSNSLEVSDTEILSKRHIVLGFGKYKGKTSSWVYDNDNQYFQWMLSIRTLENLQHPNNL